MEKYLSIITLCHNNDSIYLCLKALIPQLQEKDEIIIIDDHSSKNFLEKLKSVENDSIKIHSALKKSGSRSYNRNLGAGIAKNEILIFLDGDISISGDALEQVRNAYSTRSEVAFIGMEHAMKFDELQLELYLGRSDYKKQLESPDTRSDLYHLPLLADWRSDDLSDIQNAPFYWLRYYTSFCTILKSVFFKCGGFDENFESWGAEDVDFGYRISLYGAIGYIPEIHSLHIPHSRDSFRNELTNRRNTYYMVKKYKHWYFEALVIFGSTPEMFRYITFVLDRIKKVRFTPLKSFEHPNNLYIDVPQKVIWYDENAKRHEWNLIGIALPFENGTFEQVILSDNIFAYPEMLIIHILQEALRIGKYVYIQRMHDNIRIDWGDSSAIRGAAFPRICRSVPELLDFRFEDCGGDRLEVSSNAYGFTPDPIVVYSKDAPAALQNGCIIVNFSVMGDQEMLYMAAKFLPGIIGSYHFKPEKNADGDTLLYQSIPSDFLYMNSAIVYCVDNLYHTQEIAQLYKIRPNAVNEYILDTNGEYQHLEQLLSSHLGDI